MKSYLTLNTNGELTRLYQVTRNDVVNAFDQIRDYGGRGHVGIDIYCDEIVSNIQISIDNRLYRMLYGIFPDTGEDEVFEYIHRSKRSSYLVEFYGEMVGDSSLFTDPHIAEEKFYELLENRSLDLTNFI